MWCSYSRMRWFGHVEHRLDASMQAKCSCTEETRQVKVLVDDKKKLGMESADPQNHSEWRGRLRKTTCQTNPTLGRGKQALKWI